MQWAATLTFQTEHDSSLISPKQNCSFLLFSCGSPFPHNHSACPPFLVLSPGFSTPLAQADQTQTHWSWHIHSTLHLPPLLSPLTHTCTRSEWQQANFYTAGNCLATPPHFASPPSLPTSLDISLPHWHPPTLNPTPSPRPSEREAQPRSKTLKSTVTHKPPDWSPSQIPKYTHICIHMWHLVKYMVLKNTFVAWEEAKIKTIIYTHTHTNMHSVKLLLDNDGRESGQSAVQSETGGPGLRPIHCALIKYNRFNPHNSTACYQTRLQAWCITNSPGRPIPIALSVVPVADRNTGSLTRFWKYTWKYIWFMGVKLMFFYHLVQMCSENSLWIWFWAIPLWLKVLCKAHMRYAFHKRKISVRFAEMIVIKDFDCAFKSKKKRGKAYSLQTQ